MSYTNYMINVPEARPRFTVHDVIEDGLVIEKDEWRLETPKKDPEKVLRDAWHLLLMEITGLHSGQIGRFITKVGSFVINDVSDHTALALQQVCEANGLRWLPDPGEPSEGKPDERIGRVIL